MRRIGRCLSFTVPALLCLIFFSTCDTGTNPIPSTPGKTALAAPQNVQVIGTDFTLMWNPVQNAAKYTVKIDGSDKWSGTSTMYQLGELATAEGVHQISVQAVAAPNDSTYGNSAFSAPLACEPAVYVFDYEDAQTNSGSRAVITSGEIIIKGLTLYGASLANIVIPKTIEGATVVTIGSNAFDSNIALVSVVIAETVTQVRDNAFNNCVKLTTVTFNKPAGSSGGTATQLGAGVFTGCGVLANIIVPEDSKNDYKTIIDEKAPELAGKIVETTDSVPVDTVTLLPAAFDLSLNTTGATVTRKLNLTVTPNNATNPAVTWKSSDPNVAKVDNNGIVTAVAPGTATITVTSVADSGKTAESTVTVIGAFYAVSEVTLNETQLTLDIGDSGALTATVEPANATNKNLAWSSSDSSVAKVDNLGNVTAIKAGTATITVTSVSDGSKKATCAVTVKVPDEGVIAVTGVSVSPKTHTFEKAGETKELTATVTPDDATNTAVIWRSSDLNVAKVDAAGIVTAVGPGIATITVTTVSGTKSDTCFVTVNSTAVTGVTIDKPELSLTIGGSSPLTAGVEPADASNKDVIWSSDDESVASVDNDGLVTAVGEGTATITVTSVSDGSKKAECVVTVKAPAPDKIAVTGVSLSSNALTFESVGDSKELTVTVTPDNATNKAVWWKSDSPDIASVTDGIVTAKAPGTTKITVTSEDGSKTAICVVTVKEAPVLSGTQYTVTVELAAGSDKQVVKPGPYKYTAGESLTIELETGYTLYEWYLAGALMQEDEIVLTGLGVGFYSVQVIAHDGNGVPYSNDLYVTVAEGGGQVPENNEYQVNIEVESFEDPRFITNDSSDIITQGQDYKIFIADGYTVYEWYLEGELQTTTENPIVISAPAPGFHLIKVVAERGGIPYTNELALNVSQ